MPGRMDIPPPHKQGHSRAFPVQGPRHFGRNPFPFANTFRPAFRPFLSFAIPDPDIPGLFTYEAPSSKPHVGQSGAAPLETPKKDRIAPLSFACQHETTPGQAGSAFVLSPCRFSCCACPVYSRMYSASRFP